jgi:hypothetical protein
MSEKLFRSPIEAEGKSYGDVLNGFVSGKMGTADAEAKAGLARLVHIHANHPRIDRMVQHLILAKYEQANPTTDVTAVDWTAVIQWLVDNLPTILKLVMSLLAIFGL